MFATPLQQSIYEVFCLQFYSRLLCVGGEREPGTYCSCMHQVFLVTCILLCYIKFNSVYLLKGCTAKLYSHVRLIRVVLKSETLQLWQLQSALLCSRQSVSIKEKDCVNHVPQLFSLNEYINNFCKQRAECLLYSFIIDCPRRVSSVAGIFRTWEVRMPCGG